VILRNKGFLLNSFFTVIVCYIFLLSGRYAFSQIPPQPKEVKKDTQEAIKKTVEKKSSYTYMPIGKRDPFSSPLQEIKEKSKVVETGEVLEGIRRFNIKTLKLAGILAVKSGYVAMIKAPDGKSYVLEKNSKVGPNGRVKEIYKDRVIIEEKFKVEERDYLGKAIIKTVSNEIVLSLGKKEGGSI